MTPLVLPSFRLIPPHPYSPSRVRASSTKWHHSSFELFRPELALHANLFPIRTANPREPRARTTIPPLRRVVSHHRKKVVRVNMLHADNTGWRLQLAAATLARASRAAIKQRAVRRSRRKVSRPAMQRQGLFQETQHVESHLSRI